MKYRYWARFYCVGAKPGRKPKWFQWWISGYGMDDSWVVCALVDSPSARDVALSIRKYFYETEVDSIDQKPSGWLPGDRFPRAQ